MALLTVTFTAVLRSTLLRTVRQRPLFRTPHSGKYGKGKTSRCLSPEEGPKKTIAAESKLKAESPAAHSQLRCHTKQSRPLRPCHLEGPWHWGDLASLETSCSPQPFSSPSKSVTVAAIAWLHVQPTQE